MAFGCHPVHCSDRIRCNQFCTLFAYYWSLVKRGTSLILTLHSAICMLDTRGQTSIYPCDTGFPLLLYYDQITAVTLFSGATA